MQKDIDNKDNKLKSNVYSDESDLYNDDGFDFLDSLMGDVMGNNDSESISDNSNDDNTVEVVERIAEEPYHEDIDSEVIESHNDVDEIRGISSKRRRPLLQDIMNSSPNSNSDNELFNDKELSLEKTKDLLDNKDDQLDSTSPKDSGNNVEQRGGLLGRISSKASSQEVISSKKEDIKSSFGELENSFNELDGELNDENNLEDRYEPASARKDEPGEQQNAPRDVEKFVFNHRVEEEKLASEVEDISEDIHLDIKGKVSKGKESVLDNGSDLDSMFDNMLDNLTSRDKEDLGSKSNGKELDPEVKVPLETPEMSSIKVTPDGKSLADMLPGMRSGNRAVRDIVAEIRNQDSVVEVDGKKFSDNRYTKHIEEIEDKRNEQDERRSLSNKFIQRNAKFTEQEKIIMENLGISNEQFAKVMSSKEMTKKQKEELLGLGRYGAERHFKGRKYRTTVGDTAMLEFLVKFKFANTRILRWISNEPQNRTWRKLNRLRENGLVESRALIGVPDLWAATYAGVGVSGHSYEPGLRPMPKMTTVSSTMGINYIAACLWFNSVNVLNLDDFPQHNREIALQKDGRDRVRGEMLVSELEIRSSLGKEINPKSTTMQTLGDERLYDVIASNVRSEVDQWEQGGKVGPSPEMLLGNEYMWVLFPTSQLTMSYHVPDLVVQRERGPNGEPKSIAIEMERYEKGGADYDKIMLAYKLDEHLYEKVVWITPNTRVARALEQGARNVGFENYTIIPIITETGVYNKQDIWMI